MKKSLSKIFLLTAFGLVAAKSQAQPLDPEKQLWRPYIPVEDPPEGVDNTANPTMPMVTPLLSATHNGLATSYSSNTDSVSPSPNNPAISPLPYYKWGWSPTGAYPTSLASIATRDFTWSGSTLTATAGTIDPNAPGGTALPSATTDLHYKIYTEVDLVGNDNYEPATTTAFVWMPGTTDTKTVAGGTNAHNFNIFAGANVVVMRMDQSASSHWGVAGTGSQTVRSTFTMTTGSVDVSVP